MYSRYRALSWFITIFCAFSGYADEPQTACSGPDNLLSLMNRPSVADSVCVVPNKNAIVEMGYQYLALTGSGYEQNAPQGIFRLGLPNQFEFNVTTPNYIHQTIIPRVGFNATILGVKHVVAANARWVASLEGLVTLPSGSAAFGSRGYGEAFNGIASYTISDQLSITGMFGVTSQSESIYDGGASFTSFNPDIVLAWSKEKLVVYWEVNGQSKTAPDEGSGYNTDIGIIYLLQKYVALDVSFGQRISGSLNSFNNYVGAGITLQFSGA